MKTFVAPEVEVIEFTTEDVILTSGIDPDSGNGINTPNVS